MTRILTVIALGVTLAISAGAGTLPSKGTIEGNYVEVRSCDVYTGPCFANGEMGLTGEEAILTWDVTKGSYNGIALNGLKVIAVVKATDTLRGKTDGQKPYTAKSVVIVDAKADAAQKAALTDFAKEMGGDLVSDVVRVESTDIAVEVDKCHGGGCSAVRAEGLVDIATRCLHEHDKHCGNETAFYPPLTSTTTAIPQFTERDMFGGEGLGLTWDASGRRSAYLGTFSR